MEEVAVVNGRSKDEKGEPEWGSRLLRVSSGTKSISGQPEPVTESASEFAASSVRFATAAARHTWNRVLVCPTWRACRMPNCTRRAIRCSTT